MKQLIINNKIYAGYHIEQNCLFLKPVIDIDTTKPLMDRNYLAIIIEIVEKKLFDNIRHL